MKSDFQTILNARPTGHILALCLHPALDVTIYTQNGKEIDRREDLGGKAINLARMLHLLGAEVTLIAPNDRDQLTKALLQGCDFDYELVDTDLCLRQNFKYIDLDGTHKECNGSAGIISPQHYTQLIDRVLHKCQKTPISHLALCGSFPQGVEKGVYKYLIEQAKAQDITCVTDASGDAISLAVQAKPHLIKPNLSEFCQLFTQDITVLKTVRQVQNAVQEAFLHTNVPILCSLDKKGAIYVGHEGTFEISGTVVEQVGGFAGAGDTMLASFLYARMLCNIPIDLSLRFALSAATAKVRLPANTLPSLNQIYDEWTQTKIRKDDL